MYGLTICSPLQLYHRQTHTHFVTTPICFITEGVSPASLCPPTKILQVRIFGQETKVLILLEKDLFLTAIKNRGDVKFIFTISKNNKSPFCSKCSKQKCKHYQQYKEHTIDENNADNSSGNDSNQSNESESSENIASQAVPPSDHYAEIEPIDEYQKNY